MPARNNPLSLQIVRFALVGIVNTLTGLAVIYLLKWAFALPDFAANLSGYFVGLGVAYCLNARWTFEFRGALRAALGRFLLTIAIAYCANLAAVYAALYFSVNSYLAQAGGVVPYALITYLGSKHFVFNSRTSTPAQDRSLVR